MEGKNRRMFEGKYANAMVVSELMNEDICLLDDVTIYFVSCTTNALLIDLMILFFPPAS
uniref:Uncharacterized protein n=1 Tax=Triticum urartu TaxID=4572 RepID=A0A8R7TDV4_TRIUA